MSEIVPPSERVCERCGRKDVWSEQERTWVAAREEGTRAPGVAHCLHEWDINGSYNPIRE